MEAEPYTFDDLLAFMPEGWQAKAKELGAFERAREVHSPEELLRLLFLYLTEGKSFAGTSALIRLGGDMELNKTAVYKRIRNSGEWLKWLCENFFRGAGLLVEKPGWLGGREVCLVDGSEDVTRGEEKSYYMLHYCLDAFTLGMREFHITDIRTGEKVGNFEGLGGNDLVVGDRAYGTLPGIRYLRGKGSGYVLRLRGNAFKVYDEGGDELKLTEAFGGLGEGEYGSREVYCRIEGEVVPLRICALRKDGDSERAGLKRLRRTNQRKRGGKGVSKEQEEYNRYIMVATSLEEEVEASWVMELYRVRWQIELAFKRLKSLFEYNQIPGKVEGSVYAWFYGKLLLAGLCERLVNTGRFSPRERGGGRCGRV